MNAPAAMLHGFAPPATWHMLHPARTMLLVIDVQVDFAAPSGAMARAGFDMAAPEAAIGRIAFLLAAARTAGVPVGFARTVTRPQTDSVAMAAFYGRTGRKPDEMAICRAGTQGCADYRLQPLAGELQVAKTLYSAFVGTGLAVALRAAGTDTLVVAGLTTSCCVDCTVRDAFHHDFHVFLVADACADYTAPSHAAALEALGSLCAVLVDSETVAAGWRSMP